MSRLIVGDMCSVMSNAIPGSRTVKTHAQRHVEKFEGFKAHISPSPSLTDLAEADGTKQGRRRVNSL